MKFVVVTNKRRFTIEAKKRFDAEQKAWGELEVGEEIYGVISPEVVEFT